MDALWGSLFWLAVLCGHIGIWCAIFNRTHATAWPRKWRKIIEKGVILVVLIPLLGFPLLIYQQGSLSPWLLQTQSPVVSAYAVLSAVSAAYFLTHWLWRISRYHVPREVKLIERRYVRGEEQIKQRLTRGLLANSLRWFPGNQATHASFETRQICWPRFCGQRPIKICQLSDFHLTGQIDLAYFRWVIDQVNAWSPDLVFITGDLVDEIECLDWIQPVFEPLHAKYGKYYLLGNHDRRMPREDELRDLLEKSGLVRSGGVWHSIEIAGQVLQIAGNELPWFGGAENLQPQDFGEHALHVLLTHSPDQIDWAKPFQFDLIFAGHTHGGQIRLPLFGPIISPSKYGVTYAGGTFAFPKAKGRTIMHVSRGICGDEPIRFNCPPEISFFVIQGED